VTVPEDRSVNVVPASPADVKTNVAQRRTRFDESTSSPNASLGRSFNRVGNCSVRTQYWAQQLSCQEYFSEKNRARGARCSFGAKVVRGQTLVGTGQTLFGADLDLIAASRDESHRSPRPRQCEKWSETA
jgi:hypothetical protein